MAHYDVPLNIPDSNPPAEVRAERLGLRRIFEAALDCKSEVILHRDGYAAYFALVTLRDWAQENKLEVAVALYDAVDGQPRFDVHRVNLTNGGHIALYWTYR